jgi:sensor histidine kinase regulating citrate/malate metabolism
MSNIIIAIIVILFVLIVIALIYKRSRTKETVEIVTAKAKEVLITARILSEEPKTIYDPEQHPPQLEWAERRAYLAQIGVLQEDVEAIIGLNPSTFTRNEMSQNMIIYVRELSKA